MPRIPFEPPTFLKTRRVIGFVNVPASENDVEEDWAGRKSFAGNASSSFMTAQLNSSGSSLVGPTNLQRQKTMSGNIVVFEPDGEPPQAFWLSRKIGKSSYALFRLGYKLQRSTKPDFRGSDQAWELDLGETEQPHLVKIMILDSSVMDLKSDTPQSQSPLDVLSALQMVAQHSKPEERNVVGSNLVGTCESCIYAVLPYFPDGDLLHYCLSKGTLDEASARFLFRQILAAVKTLHDVGLCHRNLSLEALKLSGDRIYISRLDWCMRFNENAPEDEDRPVPIPCGTNPQFVAPEYFGNLVGAWNGYSADLWACGLMLYSMLVGTEALFVAPIMEDKVFMELCVKGNVGGAVGKFAKKKGIEIGLSDDLLSLLGKMLRSDPKERHSLQEVMEHPWVLSEDVVAPSAWDARTVELETF